MKKRPLVVLLAAAAALCAATAVEAGGVHWSVGVNVAPVAAYASNGPGWVPAPVRYAPPVVYAPAVYAEPYVGVYEVPYGVYATPVYHRRAYYGPVPASRWHHGWNRHERWHHDGGHRR